MIPSSLSPFTISLSHPESPQQRPTTRVQWKDKKVLQHTSLSSHFKYQTPLNKRHVEHNTFKPYKLTSLHHHRAKSITMCWTRAVDNYGCKHNTSGEHFLPCENVTRWANQPCTGNELIKSTTVIQEKLCTKCQDKNEAEEKEKKKGKLDWGFRVVSWQDL